MTSVFSQRPSSDWVAQNALAFAIRDGFPVSPGHTLVVPFREVATWFEASADEKAALLDLVEVVKAQLDAELKPDGYNVGFNAGSAAGQTVPHLHVHVIPRFHGDMPDPRGGVRHVIPWKGNYAVSSFSTTTSARPPSGAAASVSSPGTTWPSPRKPPCSGSSRPRGRHSSTCRCPTSRTGSR